MVPTTTPARAAESPPRDASAPTGNPVRATAGAADQPLTPEQLVDLLADKNTFPVPLEAAAQRLRPIADLHRETPAPEVALMVGSRPGLRRMEIAYSEDGKGHWTFSQATVLLTAANREELPALFKRFESAFRTKLGKPRFTKRGEAPLPRVGWRVRGKVELWLGEETSTLPEATAPERHLRIDIAAPAGEAE